MMEHEQFADDLALYALEALQGTDRAALEQHMEGCVSCRRELQNLRGDTALLALAAGGPRPPARSRQRLLEAVSREPRTAPRVPERKRWWRLAPLLAAAAACILILLLVRQNAQLSQTLAALQSRFSEQQGLFNQAKDIVATFTAPEAQQMTLVAAKTLPQPQGKAFYVRDRARLIFVANNLPQLPADKIYELWLIPKTGPPLAAGLFKPDAHGSATVVNPPIGRGTEAKSFVVTLEPESGSHEAPRGPAVIAGVGE
jgi:anti-sigma-K factor RskA